MFLKNLNFNKPFIIAEIGNNHEGKLKYAFKLIDEAKKSGADAVKFQTFNVHNYISFNQKERFERLKKFQLSYKDFFKLKNYSKKKGLFFISTPFDIESSNFLKKICDCLKISSGDNNYYELINNTIKTNKPILISTGFTNEIQIEKIYKFVLKKKGLRFIKEKFALLHCIASYPTDVNDTNVNVVKSLIKKYKCSIGFSDHSRSNIPAICCVGMGVKIFEKHFTLDNNFSNFTDHKVSMNPKDFSNYVIDINKAFVSLGDSKRVNFKSERNVFINNRRSVYASQNIKKGEKIFNKVKLLRPYSSKSININKIKNKKASRSFKKDEIISN